MAECKYNFKLGENLDIEMTEELLLDFLIFHDKNNIDLISNDIVFSNDVREAKLLKLFDIIKHARSLNAKLEHNEDATNLEIEHHNVKGTNVIGVTGFLKGLRNLHGKLLFPEFIPENYWNTVAERWKDPDGYTEEEKSILFEKINGVYNIDQTISFEEKRAKIEERWKAQAKIGTNIHKVLQIFFSYNKNELVKLKFKKPDDEIIKDIFDDPEIDTKYINEHTARQLISFGRKIIEKFGTDANYFPEFLVSANTSFTDGNQNQQTLLGIIDLLILDKEGKAHVVDYKTSPLDYIQYSDAKKRTFKYLMATYSRLLNINGISDAGTSVYVSPIKLLNLRKEGNDFVYDGVSYMDKLFESIHILNDANMLNNIDEFLPLPPAHLAVPEKVLEGEVKFMNSFFPEYSYVTEYTTEKIMKITKDLVTFNEETLYYVYTPKGGGSNISAKSETELYEKIRKMYNNQTSRRMDYTSEVRNRLKDVFNAINNSENLDTQRIESLTSKLADPEHGSIEWLNTFFSKYFTPGWRVMDSDMALDYLGVIMLENINTGQIDIVRIVSSDLTERIKFLKGKYITGNKLADIIEDQKPNSLILDGIRANVEYMDTMYILNLYAAMFKNKTIGEILVVNPVFNSSIFATNELLLYSWNALHKLDPSFENNFSSNSLNCIKMAKYWDLCLHRFMEIMGNTRISKYQKEKWENFRPILSLIEQFDHDEYDNIKTKRDLLVSLKLSMESTWKGLDKAKDFDSVRNPEVGLYLMVILAIGEADELQLRLTYKDRSNYIDHANFIVHGLLGLETDNPGNLADENLNNITKLVMRVYLNVRDSLQRYLPTVEEKLKSFKDSAGFTLFKERTFGNQASLYQNMIYKDPNTGNLLLKNPWKNDYEVPLKSYEVDFLKFFLTEINKDRQPHLKGILLENARNDSTGSYFYLPLVKGDSTSSIAVKGLLPALKDRLKRWSYKNIKQDVIDSIEGFFSDEENKRIAEGNLFLMTNSFNKGYSDERLTFINELKEGLAYFETNLETILLKHKFAYTTLQYMDEIFPDIQAIMMHLVVSAANQNTDFPKLTAYVENYIKSKIFNKNIDDDKFSTLAAYSKKIMSAASWLALAFNPKQLYQGIEGIWKDVSLFIRKPDGTHNFSFGNLKDAFLSTLPEMIDFSQGQTKWEALNALYGLNDMDMNTYIDRIKSDNSGIFGAFSRLSYKFASRPDFYNRATIFGALMRGDGCWDAHKMVNGRLVYDMAEDSRFNIFWSEDVNNEKYNDQKALYIAMAKQMMNERVRDENGNLWTMKDEKGKYRKLPKAYTIQLSEGYKDVADSIYGYYSHEKKALIQSHHLGAMIMQMNTYWSAKKNQYLAPGSIKLQGKMTHYSEKVVEDGVEKEVFYYTDEQGNIFTEDEMKKSGKKGIPYYAWKGLFLEGILITVGNLLNFTNGTFKERWMQIWNNPDEELRRAYRSNLGLLFYDLFMFLIMGLIVAAGLQQNAKEYIKKSNNPFANLMVDYSTNVFKQSFIDFNAVSSIAGRGVNWTPFAISKLGGIVESWSNVVAGNGTAKTALLNSMGVTRTLKPFFTTEN